MLRRSIHIILSILLLTSTTGFVFTQHQCDIALDSTSANKDAPSCDHDTNCNCEYTVKHHHEVEKQFVKTRNSFPENNFYSLTSFKKQRDFSFFKNELGKVKIFKEIITFERNLIRLSLLQKYIL